jgi:DUF4097 and DUF4098 domain-containing protein YvlB
MKSNTWATVIAIGWLCATAAGATASKVEESFQQTVLISSNAVVSLQNVNGKVRFTAWEKPEVQVNAVKRASRQSDLDAVSIEIESKPGRLHIETKYPKSRWGRSNSTSVDYEIKVPAQTRLNDVVTVNGDIEIDGIHGTIRATTVNGRVALKGLRANAHLESVNGSLEADFERFEDIDSVSLKSVNGKIHVSLPAMANATVSMNSLNGSIRTDSSLPVKKHMVGSDVRGNLGKGGGTIRAETINGSISILRDNGPENTRDDSASQTKPKVEAD